MDAEEQFARLQRGEKLTKAIKAFYPDLDHPPRIEVDWGDKEDIVIFRRRCVVMSLSDYKSLQAYGEVQGV